MWLHHKQLNITFIYWKDTKQTCYVDETGIAYKHYAKYVKCHTSGNKAQTMVVACVIGQAISPYAIYNAKRWQNMLTPNGWIDTEHFLMHPVSSRLSQ